MIFVNRHRIIQQNSGVIKDPTKYWYVEKYVYGVLKETVEVPLGTNTTFTALSSGYNDDIFYGWSINSTSTTRTFTNTVSYSNITVKNNLDENNTLKIYAVYSYSASYGPLLSNGTYKSNYNSNTIYAFYVHNNATFTFTGNRVQSGANGTGGTFTNKYGITVTILDGNGNTTNRIITNSDGTTSTSLNIKSGSYIRFSLDGSVYTSSSGGYGNTSTLTIYGSYFSTYGTSYRVSSHS